MKNGNFLWLPEWDIAINCNHVLLVSYGGIEEGFGPCVNVYFDAEAYALVLRDLELEECPEMPKPQITFYGEDVDVINAYFGTHFGWRD